MSGETPTTRIVLGIDDGDIPIWNTLRDVPVMANAVNTKRYPPSWVELWVTGGGFQTLTRGYRADLEHIANVYRLVNAKYYIMYDYPPPNNIGNREHAELNVKLYEELYSKLEDKPLIPIVHQYEWDALEYVLDKYAAYKPPVLAIGGASLSFANKGKPMDATLIYILIVRRLWTGKLHVLGSGGLSARKLLSMIGVESSDTNVWKVKASHGEVLVPWTMGCNRGRLWMQYDELKKDKKCLGKLDAYLKKTGFPARYSDLGWYVTTSPGRALINAWMLAKAEPVLDKSHRQMGYTIESSRGLEISELKRLHARLMGESTTRTLSEILGYSDNGDSGE